jgi:hypothetical protein
MQPIVLPRPTIPAIVAPSNASVGLVEPVMSIAAGSKPAFAISQNQRQLTIRLNPRPEVYAVKYSRQIGASPRIAIPIP